MSVLRQTSRRTPSVPVVVSFLMGRGAVVQPMPESSHRWPSGTYRAFLPNTSTRGLVLTMEGGRFTITVPTLACAEDRELAFLLAAEVARDVDDAIEVDGVQVELVSSEGSSEAAFARDCFDIAQRARHAVLTLPGPHRDFHVGPRLAQELGTDPAAWASAMRRVQYGTIEDAPREHRSSDRGSVSVVAVQPGTTAVLCWSDLVALGPEDDALVVPFGRFVDLAAGRAVALDERNVVIGALTHTEWDALLERAQPYAVDDLVEAPPAGGYAAPVAVEMASADEEDSPVGPPILPSSRRAHAPSINALTTSTWAVPVFASLLLGMALALGTVLVLFAAVWLGQ